MNKHVVLWLPRVFMAIIFIVMISACVTYTTHNKVAVAVFVTSAAIFVFPNALMFDMRINHLTLIDAATAAYAAFIISDWPTTSMTRFAVTAVGGLLLAMLWAARLNGQQTAGIRVQ